MEAAVIGKAYLIRADVRGTLPLADGSIHCMVTSPPYWGLRDYRDPRQIGLEPIPADYVARMVEVFREVRRVLRDDGIVWLNLGDTYNAYNGNAGPSSGEHKGRRCQARPKPQRGHGLAWKGLKPKDLIGIPWRVALALQDDGWWLRSDCLWVKRNPMRESIRDRPTKAHEYIFLLTKSERYYYDNHGERSPLSPNSAGRYAYAFGGAKSETLVAADAEGMGCRLRTIGEWDEPDSANLLTWWDIPVNGYPGAHFATFPPALPARCIRLGTSERGCCPACGASYRRVLERGRKATRPGVASKVGRASASDDSPYNGHAGMLVGNRDPQRHTTTTRTLGWEPSCSCDAGDPAPCRVLDIFSGSGTTAAVARELGRVGIGLEVNADYLGLARHRVSRPAITRDNPALAAAPRPAPLPGQMGLDGMFAEDCTP